MNSAQPTLAWILEKIRARPSGGGWIGHCPTELHHRGDRNASLSIREGEAGRILLHCFSGCTAENICSAMGISIAELFPKTPRKPDPPELRAAKRAAGDTLRSLRVRLTPKDRDLPVTIIETDREHVDLAMGRALALTVEGELVQVVLAEDRR